MLNPSWDVHIWGDIKILKKETNIGTYYVIIKIKKWNTLYIYKQGWKSMHKKYKACQSKYKHMKGKQDN
jgi:hypothetical protein